MTRIRSAFTRKLYGLMTDRSGATAVEYAMMASGVALAIVGTLVLLSDRVRALYELILAAVP